MKVEGVDFIIVLLYLGIGLDVWEDGMENVVIFLVVLLEIDVILIGYSYFVFFGFVYVDWNDVVDNDCGLIFGKFGIMVGFWGSYMGLIDLMLEWDGDSWKIVILEFVVCLILMWNEDCSIIVFVESDMVVLNVI